MRQTIKFQRVSLFRRICSIIFDGIIAVCLFVLLFACVGEPIVSGTTSYNETYKKYNDELVATNLYIYYEENDAVSIISNDHNKRLNDFCVYLINNNIDIKYKDDETSFSNERLYQLKYEKSNINPSLEEEPLFIYNEENDSFDDNIYVIDKDNNITSEVDNEKSARVRTFYQEIVNDLAEEILNLENVKGYTQKLTALTLLMFFIAIIPTILIIYLVIPLINKDGTTIGKKMLQMRVIDAKNGKNCSKFQLFIRFTFFTLIGVLLGIFTYGISIFISILMMFFNKQRQTIHDVISQTMVVCNSFGEQDKVNEEDVIIITYDDGIEGLEEEKIDE